MDFVVKTKHVINAFVFRKYFLRRLEPVLFRASCVVTPIFFNLVEHTILVHLNSAENERLSELRNGSSVMAVLVFVGIGPQLKVVVVGFDVGTQRYLFRVRLQNLLLLGVQFDFH